MGHRILYKLSPLAYFTCYSPPQSWVSNHNGPLFFLKHIKKTLCLRGLEFVVSCPWNALNVDCCKSSFYSSFKSFLKCYIFSDALFLIVILHYCYFPCFFYKEFITIWLLKCLAIYFCLFSFCAQLNVILVWKGNLFNLFFLLLYLHHLKYGLTHSRFSINLYWIN
jgi:hypothetical protein